jgi:triosephosphate isomerase
MKPLIVANWKCNPPTLAEAKKLFNLIQRGIKNIKNLEVVICPPFLYLPELLARRKKSQFLKFGAQNCFWEKAGPFTGEISPKMLRDLGIDYVIIGHSERKRLLKETMR